MPKTLIVSSCGTSLLTHGRPPEADLLKKTANSREQELSPEEFETLQARMETQRQALLGGDLARAKSLSAELNGLINYYGGDLRLGTGNIHVFVHSDTWQGQAVAETLTEWTRQRGLDAQPLEIQDLNTRNIEEFRQGMANLAEWADGTLTGYRRNRWQIVFNLVGGFKSMFGFMQVLGMFYADEMFYIFEAEDQILKLPRIPVDIEEAAARAIEENLPLLRRLSWTSLPAMECGNIPETMLSSVDDLCSLSAWGLILLNRFREKNYGVKLWESPSDKLLFGPTFAASLKGLEPEKLFLVNQRIDDLSRFAETGANVSRLDLKDLKIPSGISTHEVDAWAQGGARRLFLHREKGTWVIDRLDDHL
jgi:putative CRISPR-associated protein (TIGR02619 family)